MRLRCLATWAAATALAAVALGTSLPSRPAVWATLRSLDGTPSPPLPDQLVVAAAHLVIAGGVCWLWLLSTLLVVDAARGGSSRVPAPRWLRSLVLLGCGTLLAAAPLPAQAGHPDPSTAGPFTPRSAVAGLPLPELPLTAPPMPDPAAPPPEAAVTVRGGDTLWRIAARSLPRSATPEQIGQEADRLWRVNRAVIGDDPDLIRPGQELRS
ncbi:hypothetical protein GCM10009668_27950 [Nocardioides dubius]|uniref:LysM domain-containing protein n=1 Tax=Nocardioides dubius TaxID=317019 RepID=A0ABN1TZK7_9ACTN